MIISSVASVLLLPQNCLNVNQQLLPNQGIQDVSGMFSLWLGLDGSVCIRQGLSITSPISWCAGVTASNPGNLVMQADDNLVTYSASGPYWNSQTCCTATSAVAIIQKNGNFGVFYSASNLSPIWNCATNQGSPYPSYFTNPYGTCATYAPSSSLADNCYGPCAAGTVGTRGFLSCTPCAPGYYVSSTGQTACVCAAAGRYAPTAGTSVPSNVPPGYYQPNTCQSSYLPCPAGSYSNSGFISACTSCAAGLYQAMSAASSCSTCCAAGSFSTGGASVCTPAPSGTLLCFYH